VYIIHKEGGEVPFPDVGTSRLVQGTLRTKDRSKGPNPQRPMFVKNIPISCYGNKHLFRITVARHGWSDKKHKIEIYFIKIVELPHKN
jgi:hypothetical protein